MKRSRVNRSLLATVLSLVLCFANVPMATAVGVALDNQAITAPLPYRVGQTVQYELTATNSNPVTATVTVVDILPSGTMVTLGTNLEMAPGEAKTWYLDYVVRAQDVGPIQGGTGIINLLRVDGRTNGTRFAADVEEQSPVIQPKLGIATTVDFDGDGVFTESEANYVGEQATWRVVVTNSGDSPLVGINITDTEGHSYPTISLNPGASQTFDVPQTINSKTVLTATAAGNDEQGRPVDPVSDSAEVNPFKPDFTVEKLVDFNGDDDFHDAEGWFSGRSATWRIIVKNTGDLDLISMSISDNHAANFETFDLPKGAEKVFEYTTVINEGMTNVASVSGMDEREKPIGPKTDDASVRTLIPGIEIEKTASPTIILEGEPVTYTYQVRNTSEFDLDSVVVTDDKLGYIGTTGPLAEGQSTTVSTTTAVFVDTENVGTATGHYTAGPEDSRVVTASATEFVNVINPQVRITKSSDAIGPVEIGTVVTYEYLVENIGDVPLVNLHVTDDMIPGFNGTISRLEVGGSQSVEATSAIYEDTTNVGTVRGTDEFQHEVSSQDTETVETLVAMPDMALTKSVDSTIAIPGDLLTYTITYQNVGTGPTQSGFVIADDFDERYVDVVDPSGGTVVDGTITWMFLDNLSPADGPRTITYTVRVKDEVTMPEGLTDVLNVALVDTPGDINEENDSDDETVVVENEFAPFTEEETPTPTPTQPFLPYTGMELTALGFAVLMSGSLGAALRRAARRGAETAE